MGRIDISDEDIVAHLIVRTFETQSVVFNQVKQIEQRFGIFEYEGAHYVKGFWECDCKQNYVHRDGAKCPTCDLNDQDGYAVLVETFLGEIAKVLS